MSSTDTRSTIERIRRVVAEDRGYVLLAGEDILPLLDIVEAFAAREPMSGDTMRCIYCDTPVPMTYSPHVDTCPWLAARRLCGMEDDE